MPHSRQTLLAAMAEGRFHLRRGRRFAGLGLLACAAAVMYPAALVHAADAPPAQIPDSIKQTAAIGQDQVQQIDAAVAGVAKSLGDGSDPTAQSADRIWLSSGVYANSGAVGSPAYLQAYAHSLNQQLLPLVTAADGNFRAKIEVGLAVAQIAGAAQNTELVPLARALMHDPSPAVALAGTKSADALVATLMNKPQLSASDKQYLDELLATVTQHAEPPIGGEIAEAAYHALSQPVLGQFRGRPEAVMQILVPLVFKLEAQRLEQYKSAVPQSPQADSTGIVVLLSHDIWLGNGSTPSLTPQQQTQTLNIAADLIEATAKQAAEVIQSGKGDVTPLIDALRTDGQELANFSNPNNGVVPDQDLYTGVSHLTSLYPSSAARNIAGAGTDAAAAIRKFAQPK